MTVILTQNSNSGYAGFSGIRKPVVINVPPSKSLTHRALIAASLADGYSKVRNVAKNDDTRTTAKCLRQFGAQIDETAGLANIKGVSDFSGYNSSIIECKDSASTLRLLLPIFAQSGKICTFTGSDRLMQRPLTIYENFYKISDIIGGNSQNKIGIRASGKIAPGIFSIPGNVSSQFISGLLFVLPLLDGDSVIDIYPPFESEPYARMTMDVLKHCGIKTDIFSAKDFSRFANFQSNPRQGRTIIKVPGNQKYNTIDYTVDGDWSAAAFFVALSILTGKSITLQGMDKDSPQGDKLIAEFAEKFGSRIDFFETPAGIKAATVIPGEIKAINADISDCPDLGPALFAIAACAKGTSVFTGTARLALKESDRSTAMKQEMSKFGCKVEVFDNKVEIIGRSDIRGRVVLDGHKDHRVVMALAVLASRADGQVAIQGAEAVAKSYPDFFADLTSCGTQIQFL